MPAAILPSVSQVGIGEEGLDGAVDLLIEVGLVPTPQAFAVPLERGHELGHVVATGFDRLR